MFEKRKYVLRTPVQLSATINYIQNLPLNEEKPLEVVIQQHTKQRSLDQNSLYWKRVTEIAEQAWIEGRQYSKEAWHQYFVSEIMPTKITDKKGKERLKFENVPMCTKVAYVSTSNLSKESFGEFIEAITAFGSGIGVIFNEER
jgi:hypothetical protein